MQIQFLWLVILLISSQSPVLAAKCYGSESCRACKNCNYCQHCNSGGSPCGVYYASRGMVRQSAAPIQTAPSNVVPINRSDSSFYVPARVTPLKSVSAKTIRGTNAVVQSIQTRIQNSWQTYGNKNPFTARFSFQVTKDGGLANLKLLYSKGDEDAVAQAEESIGFATPFPKSPSLRTEDFIVNFRDGSITVEENGLGVDAYRQSGAGKFEVK